MAHQFACLEISQLLDCPVKARNGQLLGHIKEFLVDPKNGKIEYIKLNVFLSDPSLQKPSIAIPWSQFRLVNVAAEVELNVSHDVLQLHCRAN